MEIKTKEANLEPIRQLLLDSSSDQAIAITEEDVDNLFVAATMLSLSSSQGANLKEALEKLDIMKPDSGKSIKVMLLLQLNQSYQFPMSELGHLTRYINDNLPEADVCWGFGRRIESDDNVSIFAVTTY
ncbi:MAG: hypothetical protein K2H15_09420 [Muribaculaceae bacterium]|nr:hypothetical protein [Muribaculaceae bacterium]